MELHDEKLFEEPPREECPICMLPLPSANQVTFYSCCGKNVCNGCIHAMAETSMEVCPFCKTPPSNSDEEELQRINKLMERGNAVAFYQLGGYYKDGINGMPQDQERGNELWLKAGELGSADAYFNLGIAYENGRGVAIDKKKAKHYYELAAMSGSVIARHNLGIYEYEAGSHQRACKHFIIAARAGSKRTLDAVKDGYMARYVTKDEYANTLREYQKSLDEMKSDARDKAAAED